MRSKLNDVARAAGVSPATVDRVLNNRAGVRSRTRDIVIETARRLGYIGGAGPTSTEIRPAAGGKERVDFILPAGSNPFIAALHQHIQSLARFRPNLDVRISPIEGFNPDTLARALIDLRGKTRGVALIALDHPTVREAIRMLAAAEIKVVTIASDILHVPRIAYVGIDNRAAGRLAGYLLKRFVRHDPPANVALFAGSLSYRGHEEREMGFRHILAEESPDIKIVELREMLDDQDRAYAEACALIERHPDLAAIYNAGAGTAGGQGARCHNRPSQICPRLTGGWRGTAPA